MCVLTNERYNTYQTDFYSVAWVMPYGWDLGCLGAKIKFRPAVCLLCYLLLNHWTKFNQIWCVGYSHEWGVHRQMYFWPCPLGRGQKVKYHLISVTKSFSKIFIPNFGIVLTNERFKTYQTEISFCRLGHALGAGLGMLRGQNQIPSCCLFVMLSPSLTIGRNSTKFGVWVIHMNGVCNFKLFLAPGALGRGQKVKYHLISVTKSFSKIFIPNFVIVLTNERYKTYQTEILFCRLGHALGVGLGVLRGQNQIPSCCLSVMLSPPKPLDEIQPNLVCGLLT